MSDSTFTKPERALQPLFSKRKFFSSLAIGLPIFALALWQNGQPTRLAGPDRLLAGRAERVVLNPELRGWELDVPDRRFGGVSALVIDRGALLAVTDSGVALRFAPPALSGAWRVALHDLPDGPGPAANKWGRDSESLLPDPGGRGWWIGFENRHSLWLYDRAFSKVLETRDLDTAWSANRGAEAIIADGGVVVALPENGGRATGGAVIAAPGTSDATRMPDGRLVLLVRRFGLGGFATEVRIAAGAGRPARRVALDLGALDNMEGIAAQALPGGGTRLWLVSDDNFRPWMRTLLVSLDLKPGV